MTVSSKSAFDQVSETLLTWDGITTKPGRFGSTEFHYGHREVGHIHGSSHADLPFPTRIRDDLINQGNAEPHHFLPHSGWVTVSMRTAGGVERALAAFRLNYDLIVKKKQFAETAEPG